VYEKQKNKRVDLKINITYSSLSFSFLYETIYFLHCKKNIFCTPTLFYLFLLLRNTKAKKRAEKEERKKNAKVIKIQKERRRKKRDTMATDILDKHRFKNQCSLYESTRLPVETDPIVRSNSSTMSKSNRTHHKKYVTQTISTPTNDNSLHQRHNSSTDILSLLRSLAFKPFKASSTGNSFTGGQTNNVLSDSQTLATKSSVNLLRYRPLSDVVTDNASCTQSTYVKISFISI